jgi:hypothetical protein
MLVPRSPRRISDDASLERGMAPAVDSCRALATRVASRSNPPPSTGACSKLNVLRIFEKHELTPRIGDARAFAQANRVLLLRSELASTFMRAELFGAVSPEKAQAVEGQPIVAFEAEFLRWMKLIRRRALLERDPESRRSFGVRSALADARARLGQPSVARRCLTMSIVSCRCGRLALDARGGGDEELLPTTRGGTAADLSRPGEAASSLEDRGGSVAAAANIAGAGDGSRAVVRNL